MEKVVGSMVDGIENIGRFARRLGGGMFPREIPVGIVNWTVKRGRWVYKLSSRHSITSMGTVPGVNQPLHYLNYEFRLDSYTALT